MTQKLDWQSRQQAPRAYCPNIHIVPTGWNEKTLRDDISVVFVKTQFHFDEKIRPIKLGTGLPIQGVVYCYRKLIIK